MASLKEAAKNILYEAQDGIAFLVLWKEGRGWKSESYYEIEYDEGKSAYSVDRSAVDELKQIVRTDPDAIAVCGYYDNIGPMEDMTLGSLIDGLRFQYKVCPGSLLGLLNIASVR